MERWACYLWYWAQISSCPLKTTSR